MAVADRAIICVGNRFMAEDDTGLRVFELFSGIPLPDGVELVDGGLGGLNLLSLLEGRTEVIFVDTLDVSMTAIGEVIVLDGREVAALAESYGHAAGLPYLLHMLPLVCPPPWPRCRVVGTAAPATRESLLAIVRTTLELLADASAA
ncbi:MAG: hydrogenase maturation protease [Magnetococcus sp. YQC-9]